MQKDIKEKRRVIDPVLISKISRFIIKSRLVSSGELSGKRRSIFKGHSLEFSHHREYSKGDDLRLIDWKVFGRKDKFYIKQFEAETNLKATILLDVSSSFDYKDKFEYSAIVASSLVYLFLINQDSVNFITFSENPKSIMPLTSFKKDFYRIIDFLEKVELKGKTDISKTIVDLGNILTKRNLIILISDLWDESDFVKSIKILKSKKHDISILHILHKDEVNPPEGYFKMIDMETEKDILIDSKFYRNLYAKKLKSFTNYLEKEFKLMDVDYFFINTEIPVEKNLIYWLKRREIK